MLPTKQQIAGLKEKIRNDPEWFIEKVLCHSLWDKTREIVLSVQKHHETAVRSCHGSGKTFTAADIVHWWLCSYDDAIVVTTAPTDRQVKEILWRDIRNGALGKGLYPKDAVLEKQINLGEKWFAIGFATDRQDMMQGFHSPHLLVIVDEASGVTQPIFEAIDGLNPERVLLLGNPLLNTGRFADDFKSPHINKIHISAHDTPNIKEHRTIIPGLITDDEVNLFRERYGEDSDVYRVRILGEFPKGDSDSLIAVDDIVRAMERVTTLLGFEKKMGVDVARYGDDRTAILIRQAQAAIRKEVFSGQDLMTVTGHVIRIAKEENVRPNNIYVDVIGVGAGVVDRLREQGWNINAVNVADKAKDTEQYANLRCELYNGVKEWLATASLPKDDDYYEMANIKYSFNSRGQMLLESKEDMKKRGLSSPDVADALALTFARSSQLTGPIEQSKPIMPFYPELGY